ncbi:uncharacterized protein LOC134273246 [Saccostrea cucullata]|uniref:uncharacterized protein LOC134273246 n=1 Tax=Saccostrea cuccullata TaxID=36930 RepID=UPI002ED2186C
MPAWEEKGDAVISKHNMGSLNHFAILSHCLVIIVLTTCAAKPCPLSARTKHYVKQCPEDKESTDMRAKIKDCDKLAGKQTCTNSSKKFKYHCLPTDLSGTLVEVCAVEIDIYGECVLYNNTVLQTYESRICSQSSRCPKIFLSSEAHLCK